MGNWLCVRELLNVLAANGEQGELGSDWCSGSWVLRVFRGVRFWGVPSMFWVVFVDGRGVLRPVTGVGFGMCLEEGLF